MRLLFYSTCLANIAYAIASIKLLPDPVATKFDFNGNAGGFMSPVGHAVQMSGMTVFLVVLFAVYSWLMPILPAWCFNIPNRNYWLNEENRLASVRRMRIFLDEIGTGIILFIFFTQWGVIQANRVVPPKLNSFVMGRA